MAFHFEFDKKNKILLTVIVGEYGDAEAGGISHGIRACCNALGEVRSGIADFSSVSSFHPTAAALQRVAKEDSPYPPDTRRYVVSGNDYMFGMSRLYQLAASKTRSSGLKTVRSREEALADLGVRDAKFERVNEPVGAV